MQHAPSARGRPVFLDRSGRRRRLVLVAGAFVGVLLVASLGLLAAGLTDASPTRLPGFPDAVRHVEQATPAPSASSADEAATTSASDEEVPATLPTPGASPSSGDTNRGRNPTHTPSHPPKPTKNQ
jgi:hypothetical protein